MLKGPSKTTQNFSDARSARLASRTRRVQGVTVTRSRRQQSATVESRNDATTTPVSPVASLGSPPHRRRVGRPRRTILPSNQEAIAPVNPLHFGYDVGGEQTPRSHVSVEGEEPGRAQGVDGEGATPDRFLTTLPTSNEQPDDGPIDAAASAEEGAETENRSSGGSVVNFDTTSEQERDDLTIETSRKRPARTEVVRKKRRHDRGDVGERVRHLERLLRDITRTLRSKDDGHPSQVTRDLPDARGATRPNVVPPPRPPASPASWGTFRSRDDTIGMTSTRGTRSPTRSSREARQDKPTSTGQGNHDHHQVTYHDGSVRARRRGGREESRVSLEDRRESW
jgi:hypothetical protein